MPAQLGGAPKCPLCTQSVYYYDSKGFMGRTWHKKCFKCASCTKVLESGICNLLSDEAIVCNGCYRKLASATTAPAKPREEYVNRDDEACCPRCGRRVYFAEQLLTLGRKWHKACFSCASCNKKLDSTTAADHDEDLYCRGCHSRKFGPKGYGFAGGSGTGLSMETGERFKVCRENVPHTAQAYMAPVTHQMRNLDIDHYDGNRQPANGHTNGNGHHDNGHSHPGNGYTNGYNSSSGRDSANGYTNGGRQPSNGHSSPNGDNGYSGRHASASAAPRRVREFGGGDFCPRCDQRVFIAEKRQAAGNVYHDKCFTCSLCHKKLDSGKLTEKDQEIFCKVCYGKNFGPKGYGFGSGAGTLSMSS